MNNAYDKIPKYLKQKESNVSKAHKKSKHKHQYAECLLQYYFKGSEHIHTSLNSYCIICGKIGDRLKNSIVSDYLKTKYTNGNKYYSIMSGEELYKKYHNRLPVFFIKDYFKDKYVNLNQSKEKEIEK